jgi:hypothetical protein
LELLELFELDVDELEELVVVDAVGALTWPPPTVTRTTRVTTLVLTGRSLVTTRGRRGRGAVADAACSPVLAAASRAVSACASPVAAPVAPATAQVASPVTAATASR